MCSGARPEAASRASPPDRVTKPAAPIETTVIASKPVRRVMRVMTVSFVCNLRSGLLTRQPGQNPAMDILDEPLSTQSQSGLCVLGELCGSFSDGLLLQRALIRDHLSGDDVHIEAQGLIPGRAHLDVMASGFQTERLRGRRELTDRPHERAVHE